MDNHTQKVKIAVIGAGQVSQHCHIRPLSEHPQCEIIALADLRPDLCKIVSEKWQIPHIFQSHKDLLELENLDGVIIVTNRPATGPIVHDFLSRRIPVLTEKPMGHTVDQAKTLLNIALNTKTSLHVGYMKRWDVGLKKALGLVKHCQSSQEAGTLLMVQAWSHAGNDIRPVTGFEMTEEIRPIGLKTWPIAPDWLDPQYIEDYASFVNIHVHGINLLHAFFDQIDISAAASGPHRTYGIELSGSGVPIQFSCANMSSGKWSEGLKFIFEKGTIIIHFPAPFSDGEYAHIYSDFTIPTPITNVPEMDNWAFRNQAWDFIHQRQLKSYTTSGAEQAVKDMVVIEKIWKLLTLK